MKSQSKPIIAFAAGVFLFAGALTQSARAQGVWTSNTVSLAAANNNPADALSIQYVVTYDGTSTFHYTYDIMNPSTDTGYVGTFEVSFDSTKLDAVETPAGGSFGGISFTEDGVSGVTWKVAVAPGASSGPLSFDSIYSPDPTTANASGAPSPNSWASLPNGQLVVGPNPPVVPEPATISMLGLTALGAFFRSKNSKK
jgi:hypothetical protein